MLVAGRRLKRGEDNRQKKKRQQDATKEPDTRGVEWITKMDKILIILALIFSIGVLKGLLPFWFILLSIILLAGFVVMEHRLHKNKSILLGEEDNEGKG